MRVLIIYAHPSKESFTFKILNQFIKGLTESKHEIEVSDLYQTGFVSDMTEIEYSRESFANTKLPISSDVLLEHEKLNKADCVCFLYPVWWSDCPAKLKGWFDRVFSAGFAYSKTSVPRGMKTMKRGIVICTAGHSKKILQETGILQSMKKIMISDRLGDRFMSKEMIIFDGTLDGVEIKNQHLEKVYQIGKNFT